MKYIAVGLIFGIAWAAIQYSQGEFTKFAELGGPVLLCGAFGAVLWLARVIYLKLAGRE